jgi:tRNA A37 threonylcarbamoyladenosine synthetase subunit TsaC/SUA5/YrdC
VSCKEIYVDDALVVSEAISVFESLFPVILIELPSVYALIAPPTSKGVEALHQAKQRIGGKFYGTAIGSLDLFMQAAKTDSLPDAFKNEKRNLDYLEGAFIRLVFTDESISTPVIASGTHQALLLPSGSLRDFFTAMEAYGKDCTDNMIFPDLSYTALLCTSANISGHPEGSITEFDKARSFALDRNISLFIRMGESTPKGGSFPIFSFRNNQCKLARNGPGASRIIQSLPMSIQLID